VRRLLVGRANDRLVSCSIPKGSDCSRAGGGATEGTVIDVTGTTTCRLDVRLGPLASIVVGMKGQCVEARQSGACREEQREKNERFEAGEPASGRVSGWTHT
jgi:hypothetical protein